MLDQIVLVSHIHRKSTFESSR